MSLYCVLHQAYALLLCKLVCVCWDPWLGNKVCVFPNGGVFVCRAGAYLLTAAVLAAFSSACCCKTFRLTFHAEIKYSGQAGEETGATGGNQSQ